MHATPATLDTDALRRKYLQERDKRLRPDGEAQFIEAKGQFADFTKDPYITEPLSRAALSEDIDVLVVGAGFGGMLTGMALHKAGVKRFRIIDVAGDFGGTWYWNRYPGVRCDIESYLYMPRLEEVGTVPSERYATGQEIFEHSQRFARHFRLYERALFQTRVQRIVWNEQTLRWHVNTDRGDELRARFVTLSQGPLAKLKLPGIPGMLDFKGRIFHSSRWDYAYTGGDSVGGMTKLADKRIGVIGTGATAIQIVPKMAEHAKQVLVFQRTPSAVAARNNRPTDVAWFEQLAPGWQLGRMVNFAEMINFKLPQEDLVQDCWTDFFVRFGQRVRKAKQAGEPMVIPALMQEVDYAKMEEIRAHVDRVIEDRATAEASKPWYNFLCKRPLFSDDYLQAFNRPNVKLVNTDGRGVECITATAALVDGHAYELDAIVLATGFDVGAPPHRVGEYDLRGVGGLTIDQKWARGARTLHGTQMAGFPNLHIVGGNAQGAVNFNYTHVLEIQSKHAVEQIARCLGEGVERCEVTEAAEARWNEVMQQHHHDMTHFYEDCTPGFLNNEGQFRERPTFVNGAFNDGPLEYQRLIDEWRRSGFAEDTRRA